MRITTTLVLLVLSGQVGRAAGMPADGGAPAIWIGVRMLPVPEALAAHLGRGGLMVGNVVTNSPADRAGLERYDVLVSFDGQAVEKMEDLQSAVGRAGAGREVALVLIRGGRETTVKITPERRPDPGSIAYKYDEPVDDVTRYFGHTLRPDGFGNWMLQPLGRLRDLPDAGGGAADPAWKALLDQLRSAPLDALRFDALLDPNTAANAFVMDLDEDDAAGQADISISVTQDGRSIKVQRGGDGRISVTRVDADGRETSATYDSAEAFRQGDPEAYRTYRRHAGLRTRPWITVMPQMQNLPQQQRQWTEQLRRQLEQQVEQARRLAEQAQRAGDVPRRIDSGPATVQRSFSATSLRVGDDGRITLEITRDGIRKTYEFDSPADFRQKEPELYEQFKGLIEGIGGGKRTQSHEAAMARAA